jgi:hypothetical protein
MTDSENSKLDPTDLIRKHRPITGMSAVFLPFLENGAIDWQGFSAHLLRTINSGLIPAVNMDTGSVQFLTQADRLKVLEVTANSCELFVAGACVVDQQGDRLNLPAYHLVMEEIMQHGGIPVVFPSWGLNSLDGPAWTAALEQISVHAEKFIAFELGRQFVPYGRIFDLESWSRLLDLPNCIGAKHSSLNRLLTGNDLAIDMVMYGSDYLLGLSSFAPELFAQRDRFWLDGDPDFYPLNDLLQYLGQLVFRAPVPSYKHSAAQFLKLCGTLQSNHPPPGVKPRPDSDIPVLTDIAERLGLIT